MLFRCLFLLPRTVCKQFTNYYRNDITQILDTNSLFSSRSSATLIGLLRSASPVVSPQSIMSYCFRIFRASIRRYVNALLFRRLGRKHTVSSIILLLCSRFVVIYFVLKFNMNTSIFFIICSL